MVTDDLRLTQNFMVTDVMWFSQNLTKNDETWDICGFPRISKSPWDESLKYPI